MKKIFRNLALILAFVILLSSFVACNDSDPEEETTVNDANETTQGNDVDDATRDEAEETTAFVSDETTEDEFFFDDTTVEDTVEDTVIIIEGETTSGEFIPGTDNGDDDYGSTFYLSIMTEVNPIDYYWIEENDNSAISNALYTRQQNIMEQLGIEIFAFDAGYLETYTEDFKNSVIGKTGTIDALITHPSVGISNLVTGGYLASFDEVPGIDLEADYWNRSLMEELSIKDLHLLGFSNFNVVNTYVITYNPDILAEYQDSLSKSLYQMVDDHEWTLQQFADIAKLGYVNNGHVDSNRYGLTGLQWVPWCGFLEASDINLVERDSEGTYKVSFANETYLEKTKSIVALLSELSAAEYTCLDFMSTATPSVPYWTGRALMTLSSTYELDEYTDYHINFGVLPYPMYDVDQQEYRSLQWGGYIAIPAYMENVSKIGKTLDMLASLSFDVKNAYYETALGAPIEEKTDDFRMLEIVWNSASADFAIAFDDVCGSVTYMLPYVTTTDSRGMSLAQYANARIPNADIAIGKFFKRVDKKY